MKGILVALVTPFDHKEELNLDILTSLINFDLSRGADGFWIMGTTGEFNMLNIEEKKLVAKKVMDVAKGKVILGINENSLYNSIKLAKYYVDLGADGIFSIPPLYHKTKEKGIIQFYTELAKFGSKTYVYNIPALVGYNVPLEILVKLASENIIHGIKYSTSDFESLLNYFRGLKEANKDIEVFTGNDKFALISFMYGIDGIVSAIANFAPEILSQVYKNVKESKYVEALKYQEMVDKLVEATSYPDYPSGIKIALRYRGFSVGSVRKPLEENITAESTIYHVLKQLNL